MSTQHIKQQCDTLVKTNPGQGLILLGHLMMGIGQREDDFIAKVELKGDATKSSYLTIKYISDNNSAVYFSATCPHTDIDSQNLIKKLSSLCYSYRLHHMSSASPAEELRV